MRKVKCMLEESESETTVNQKQIIERRGSEEVIKESESEER